MTTAPRSTAALFIGILLASATLLTGDLLAVPPAAPTNGSVQFTRAGFPANNTSLAPVADTWHSYSVKWQDNAIDEEGYIVAVRYGNGGPFYPGAQLAANAASALISVGVPAKPDGVEIQFQITAWKHNGTALEMSSLNINTHIPSLSGATTFAAPTGLTATFDHDANNATPLDDGRVRLDWVEASNSELFYQVQLAKAVTAPAEPAFNHVTFLPINTTRFILNDSPKLGLVPGDTYTFTVRPTRIAPGNLNLLNGTNTVNAATPVNFTMPALTAPSDLFAPALADVPASVELDPENEVFVRWTDNSNNETGYRVYFRPITSGTPPAFTALSTTSEAAANSTSIKIGIGQLSTAEIKLVAVYRYRKTGETTDTVIESPLSSNIVTVNTLGAESTFDAPSNLTAATSGTASTIDLTWQDNTTSEVGFNIYCRPAGTTGTLNFCRAVAQNVEHVSVNSFTTSSAPNGVPIFTQLTAGTAYEFVVRAVGANESIFSSDSSAASATAGEGFTSRLYQPITQGVAFNHTPTTSNPANRTAMTATGLPPGLSINSSTGLISGTPTQAGVFPAVLTATFSSGPAVSATLMLRVESSPATPTVGQTIPSLTVGINEPFLIPLSGKFADADSELAARLVTTKGNIDLLLYPSLAPQAVTNFLNHLLGGDYNNMVFHRHSAGFVIQGGSIHANLATNNLFNIQNRFPSPTNEPGISNLRGTVAAAKTGARPSLYPVKSDTGTAVLDNSGAQVYAAKDESFGYVGNPDSATTDFFISLADNSFNLDNQNSGFTAYARVAGFGVSGHPVVSAITALPIANYGAPLDSLPVDAASAPATLANLNVEKTVRVTQSGLISPLTYTFDAISANIATVTVEGNDLRIVGLAAGTRIVNVTATDLDGKTVSQPFTITVTPGHKAPAITAHPVGLTVTAGSPATFKVTATGTNVGYQWRREGAPILGKIQSTLTLPNVQAGDTGLYDVVVTNATTTLTSNPARLSIRSAPDITGSLPHRLITAGTPLVLEATLAAGAPDPSFVWKRGTTTVTGQTTKKLNITAAKLTDAGIYKATATNPVGSDTTTSATICVVDAADTIMVTKPGGTVKLPAPAAGPDMTYQWLKNGSDINTASPSTPAARFSGVQDPVLIITNADPTLDSADYTCRITAPEGLGTVTTGKIHLAVSNTPGLTNFTLPDGIVGAGYRTSIPYNKTDLNTVVSFAISSGLPPGLKLNATTGFIEGTPTKAGAFSLRVTAKNPAGTSTAVTGNLFIRPLGGRVAGSFLAAVAPSSSLNASKGGRLDLTITDNSAFSAKLQMGKDTFTNAGNLGLSGTTTATLTNGQQVTLLVYSGNVSFTRKNLPALRLEFQIIESTGAFSASITDGTNSADTTGFRIPWNGTTNPYPYSASYNIGLHLRSADLGKPGVPQGDGYVRAVISYTGVCNFTGRLADGTPFTASSILGDNRQMVLFQMLNMNTGSILSSDFTQYVARRSDDALLFHHAEGALRWIKDAQTPATERNYRAGIPETTLDMRGNIYNPPGTNTVIGGLPNLANNARLDFSEGGLAAAARNPDKTFRLQTSHLALIAEPNPAKVSFTISPSTGLYSGNFELLDGGITRRVSYYGLIIPKIDRIEALPAKTTATDSFPAQPLLTGSPMTGAGQFMLPELLPTATTSKLLSGKAKVLPDASITPVITQQPTNQSVTSGSNATFTIVATTTTGFLTYQWQHNGINLTDDTNKSVTDGAQTATLVVKNIDDNDVGDYTCLVSNGGVGTLSNIATLIKNTPVTSAVIARTPADEFITPGSDITFDILSNDGNAPFTYQWRKSSINIPGATSATYTITAAALADSGDYTVAISNTLTTSGFVSNAVHLDVQNPITNVVAVRSPSAAFVATSSSVTFSVTADGVGPFAYQWVKGTTDISGATSSSYIINTVASTDAGAYRCRVSNQGLSGGVLSNQVQVNVMEGISDIMVTKSYTTQGVPVNSDITLNVTATGGGTLTYQWRRNGTPISGATGTSYTGNVGSTPTTDIYDVLIFNPAAPDGIASSPVNVIILQPITSVFANRTPDTPTIVALSAPVVFSVTPDGSGPYTYIWRKNGSEIPGATGPTYTLNIPVESDDGSYDCIVNNLLEGPNVTSNTVLLDVIPPP